MTLSELGETIRRRRREKGLTQEETARRAGISRPTLSRMEQGRFANVSVRTLFIVLDALDQEFELKAKNPLGLPVLRQEPDEM